MTRRRIVLAGLLALIRSPGQSQAPRRTLAAGETLRGRFEQERHLRGFERPLRSGGDFILVPGRGLIWRTETPFPTVTAITPSGLVQQVEGREVVNLPAAKVPFLTRLYDMFGASLAGDWSSLQNQFDLARSGSDNDWTIKLLPRASGAGATPLPIRSVELRGSAFLDSARIDKPDGDWDRLIFSNQRIERTPLDAGETALLPGQTR